MTQNVKARILIVDDHPLVREGLHARIASEPDMLVHGEASSVSEAMAMVTADPPDLITVDISLGEGGSGLDLIKRLKAHGYNGKVLALSAHEDALYAERSLKAGADGYIGKTEAQAMTLKALRVVLAGGRYLSPILSRSLIDRALGAGGDGPTTLVARLSDRELQVFQLIGRGMTGKAIAAALHLSRHTIDSHREKIKQKLGLKNGAELQRVAMQCALESDRSPPSTPES